MLMPINLAGMKELLNLLDTKMFRMLLTSLMTLSSMEDELKLLMIAGRARRGPEAALDPDQSHEADQEAVEEDQEVTAGRRADPGVAQRLATASRERNQEAAVNQDPRAVTSPAQDPRTKMTGRVVQNQEARVALVTATIGI